jgi:hypothetical protein
MLSDTPPTNAQIEAMTERQYRTYEAKVRRAAHRQGLALTKSRRRDPRVYDYFTYQLYDPYTRTFVVGDRERGYGFSLKAIHAWLIDDDRPTVEAS